MDQYKEMESYDMSYKTALLPDAWFPKLWVGESFLQRVRRVTQLSESQVGGGWADHSVYAERDFRRKMVGSNDRIGCLKYVI